MEKLTKIELTNEEAILFVQFQKRYSFMQLLESVNAFDIKGGSVTVHFDRNGLIQSVDKQERYAV